jgi:glycosyltransferase involved in cell wall biosynthesis
VEFTGYISDEEELQRRYRESDVFVLPSLKEAVPWVLYEAALSGLPIVATRVGGIPSFFEHAEEGLLVSPGEPPAIASGIERIVHDDSLRSQLVKNARGMANAHVEGDPAEQRLELISGELESSQ